MAALVAAAKWSRRVEERGTSGVGTQTLPPPAATAAMASGEGRFDIKSDAMKTGRVLRYKWFPSLALSRARRNASSPSLSTTERTLSPLPQFCISFTLFHEFYDVQISVEPTTRSLPYLIFSTITLFWSRRGVCLFWFMLCLRPNNSMPRLPNSRPTRHSVSVTAIIGYVLLQFIGVSLRCQLFMALNDVCKLCLISFLVNKCFSFTDFSVKFSTFTFQCDKNCLNIFALFSLESCSYI